MYKALTYKALTYSELEQVLAELTPEQKQNKVCLLLFDEERQEYLLVNAHAVINSCEKNDSTQGLLDMEFIREALNEDITPVIVSFAEIQ